MQQGQKFNVAGGFDGDIADTAWHVTSGEKAQPDPVYSSNAEETDTRLWLHVKKTHLLKILIMSPDTNIYHIGLPPDHGNEKDTSNKNIHFEMILDVGIGEKRKETRFLLVYTRDSDSVVIHSTSGSDNYT